MANIDKELNTIKKGIYGRDVRGGIHDGIDKINKETEIATDKSNEAIDVTNKLLDESFDSSLLNENFEQRLDAEVRNLQPEWTGFKDDVTTQLAETEQQINSVETANAKEPLNIINYLGNIQNIHPKVLFISPQFNGYYYWMAYTPYPNGDVSAENPCIAVSNDLIHWTVPSGLVNPLDPQPSYGYNNDTHLLYRSDINQLEIWWRSHDPMTANTWLHRRTSTNGVNWTPKQDVYYAPNSSTDPLSPAIIFEDGKYKMWAVNRGSKEVVYLESIDAISWSEHEIVPIDWGNLTAWHLDVIRTDKGLEFVVQAWQGNNGNNNAEIYYVNQKIDGTTTKPRMMIKKSSKPNAFDRTSIYRSSLLKTPHNDQYYLFYTALGGGGFRSIGLASGSDPTGLNGFDVDSNVDYKFGEAFKVEDNATLTGYDINGIDNIFFTGTSTVNSLKGGYRGKRVMLILNSSDAIVTIKSTASLQTPKYSDIVMDKDSTRALELVCTNTEGTQFKVVTYTNNRSKFIAMSDDTTLTNFDVSEFDMLLVSATNKQIDTLSGGYIGKEVKVAINGSNAKATLTYSGSLLLPNRTDFVLDNTNGLITLICVNTAGTSWRMLSS